MTKEEAMILQPFDVVVEKIIVRDLTTNEKQIVAIDLLVKKVTDNGVFCLPRIQSTAVLYKFEQIERQ
jgi:hypothetical protein